MTTEARSGAINAGGWGGDAVFRAAGSDGFTGRRRRGEEQIFLQSTSVNYEEGKCERVHAAERVGLGRFPLASLERALIICGADGFVTGPND